MGSDEQTTGAVGRVLFLQRQPDTPRWITNLGSIMRVLSSHRPLIKARAQRMEMMPLLEQFVLAASSNILVGSHGAGLAWSAVMPSGSSLLEVMPAELPGYIV